MGEASPCSDVGTAKQCSACGSSPAEYQCMRCREVSYCDKECQQLHWRAHRAICRKISAPPGGADAGAGHDNSTGRSSLPPHAFGGESGEAVSSTAKAVVPSFGASVGTGGLNALAAVSRQLEDPAANGRMMARGTGGLRALAKVSEDFARSEMKTMPALQGMHTFIAAEVACEKQLRQLVSCLRSIAEQWRAPPDWICISWHATDELRADVSAVLDDFKKCIDSLGERVAYNAAQERVVRSHVHLAEQKSHCSQFQHFRELLPVIPESDDNWVIFSNDTSLWHPGRTAFLRNFTRQVPGPDECTVGIVPLHMHPVRNSMRWDRQASEVGSLKECMELHKQNHLVYSTDNKLEPFQFAVRRSILASFFDRCSDVVLEHKLCYGRFAMFLTAEHRHKCRWIQGDNPALQQLKEAHMWLILDRRAPPAKPLDNPEAPTHPARGFGYVNVAESDRQYAIQDLDLVNTVHIPGLDADQLAEDIAELRKLVEWCTLLQWAPESRQGRIAEVRKFVESEYMNDSELVDAWTTPMLERLLDDCLKAFSLEAFAEPVNNCEGGSCTSADVSAGAAK